VAEGAAAVPHAAAPPPTAAPKRHFDVDSSPNLSNCAKLYECGSCAQPNSFFTLQNTKMTTVARASSSNSTLIVAEARAPPVQRRSGPVCSSKTGQEPPSNNSH
jgi:hypothetical protein